MTGLFRPLKRRTGIVVTGMALAGVIGVLLSLFAGDAVLVASAALVAVGYGVALLVGLFTARNPQSVAYLAVAGGGVLVVLAALSSARVTFIVAALLLAVAGAVLYRAGQLPDGVADPEADSPGTGGPAASER